MSFFELKSKFENTQTKHERAAFQPQPKFSSAHFLHLTRQNFPNCPAHNQNMQEIDLKAQEEEKIKNIRFSDLEHVFHLPLHEVC